MLTSKCNLIIVQKPGEVKYTPLKTCVTVLTTPDVPSFNSVLNCICTLEWVFIKKRVFLRTLYFKCVLDLPSYWTLPLASSFPAKIALTSSSLSFSPVNIIIKIFLI